MNLSGSLSIKGGEPFTSNGRENILLLTLDHSGEYLGHEQYGNEFTCVNGIFHLNGKVAITGRFEGNTNIQDQQVESKTGKGAYTIYLKDYDPFLNVEDLLIDPGADLNDIYIYPNPVTNQDRIHLRNENIIPDINYEVRVYDNLAQLQMSKRSKTRFKTSNDEFHIATLAPGLYHVFVIQKGIVNARGRFTVAR